MHIHRLIGVYRNEKVKHLDFNTVEGRRGRDRMVAGFTTAYAISNYHH